MIRPRWSTFAKAPFARQRARARFSTFDNNSSTFVPGFNGGSNGSSDGKRQSNEVKGSPDPSPAQETRSAPWEKFQRPASAELLPHERRGRDTIIQDYTKKAGQHQLVVWGVNPNLQASDFSRIAAQGLSEWQSGITEISQERDLWSFEPLGNFVLTFESNDAAMLYQAKLDRLFRLAQLKERSQNGLWINKVPNHLRGFRNPEDELAAFTVAPGTLGGTMNTKVTRVTGRWPWQLLASELIERSGYTLDPALVLLHMHHSSLTMADMQAFIDEDGKLRNDPWAVKSLYNLSDKLSDNYASRKSNKRSAATRDPAFRKMLRNRFILVCESPDVAWRFIRSWNQRVLTKEVKGKILKTVLTASYIEV